MACPGILYLGHMSTIFTFHADILLNLIIENTFYNYEKSTLTVTLIQKKINNCLDIIKENILYNPDIMPMVAWDNTLKVLGQSLQCQGCDMGLGGTWNGACGRPRHEHRAHLPRELFVGIREEHSTNTMSTGGVGHIFGRSGCKSV